MRVPRPNLATTPPAVIRCAAVILSTLMVSRMVAAHPLFEAPYVTYAVAGAASLAATSDFDGDGNLDLVVANGTFQGPRYLTVLLGTNDGGFTALDALTIDAIPHASDLVDVDADGDLDLVAVHFGESLIRVFVQTEPGVFKPGSSIQTVSSPAGIVVGDLDQDGRMDLVVRPYWSNTLGVHRALPRPVISRLIVLPDGFVSQKRVLDATTRQPSHRRRNSLMLLSMLRSAQQHDSRLDRLRSDPLLLLVELRRPRPSLAALQVALEGVR